MLDAETPNTSNGAGTLNSELEGYPLAKVIQGVGKTMENGKNLLAESKKADEDTSMYRDGNETEDIWKDHNMGKLTSEGRAFWGQISGIRLKEHVDFVLNSSDLQHINKEHFGENEKD